ncbi:unnamed protein product [Ectocarpus sp. CCAP 1310/34]|nr:unnamed protein product [Ectocarpus sp. CCAP 1310/34]
MPTRSTAFSSFDVQPRSGEGINGSLTPARPPRQNTKSTHGIPIYPYDASNENASRHARQGDRGSAGLSAHVGEVVAGEGMPSGLRQGSRSSDPLTGCAAGKGGINLQATEAKIDELERGEFDLKLKLFYMEEQLELAAGGTDVLQLHKEVMEAKLHRAQAEERARAAGDALSGLEAKCRELQAQVRDVEAQRAKDRENWASLEGESETKLRKHTHLLEDALRAERAENQRLRAARDNRRRSWDVPGGSGEQQPRASPRRRSSGEYEHVDQVGPRRVGNGSWGGLAREHHEHDRQLAAKVRSQDSSLRSLRADVSTLRRRLRTQAETLVKQREENTTVRRAAEQVACVEAEEIARLAVDLERAVRAANAEAEKRRHAEKCLQAAETRLLDATAGCSPLVLPRPERARSPRASAGRVEAPARREAARVCRKPFGPPAVEGCTPPGSPKGGSEKASGSSLPPSRGALGSTIASRGRSAAAARRKDEGSSAGKGRSKSSPSRGRDTETKSKRRPWGSSPPPSPPRGGSFLGKPAIGSKLNPSRLRRPGDNEAEQKRTPPRRRPGELIGAAKREAAGSRGNGTESRGVQTGTTQNPSDFSVGPREADSAGESRRGVFTTVEWRGSTAPRVDKTAKPRIEAASAGRDQGITPMAGGIAAAIRGVDLKATIARELRAAVATTPASAVSSENFNGGDGGGQRTPAGGSAPAGGDRQREKALGELDEGDLLNEISRGSGKCAWAALIPDTVAGGLSSAANGGRALKSREVAELESDVQHIFQFFAAKDGRKGSGSLLSRANGAKEGETDFLEDIGETLL